MGALLYWLSYESPRVENLKIQLLFGGLFLVYGYLVFLLTKRNWKTTLLDLFIAGAVLRGLLIFSTPNLSDDFYRFSWDGYLINNGYNPFESTPADFVADHPNDEVAKKLFEAHSANFKSGMNSKEYYSIYPTVNQSIYAFSYWITGSPNNGNLVVMKIILFLFECFTFFVLIRLLRLLKKAEFLAMLYWLNPLVIVEFVGNLHFDGIALTFLLFSYYLLKRHKLVGSGSALAVAIATKLNPVFLACISWREMKFGKLFKWWVVTGLLSLLLLSVVLNFENFENFLNSFRLYFFVFQFNSSLISFIGEFGGPKGMELTMAVLPVFAVLGIFSLNLLKGRWGTAEKLMLAYTIYFVLGTTVHPWYITILIPFAILSNWKFPFVWSYVIVWTYSFYHPDSVDQNGWVMLAEYLIVGAFIWWDIKRKVEAKSANLPTS
jgi:hypothetical protein